MAEVSKESINDDVSVENTDNVEIVNDSSVETKTGSTTEVNTVNKSSNDDVDLTANSNRSNTNNVNGMSLETKKVVSTEMEVKNTENNSSDDDDDDVSVIASSNISNGNKNECNSETVQQLINDDSVTIISENEKILISLDVDKLLGNAPAEMESTSANVNDNEEENDNEVVEVTSSTASQVIINELNIEEGGEWSVKSRLQSFIKWSRSKGINLSSKVEVTCEGTCHRYGMLATDNIKRGETILTTPRAMIFNPDNSRIVAEIVDYEDWLDSIGQSLDDSSGWATLLIALMVEYNDVDSFWAPYLRLVPKPEECGHPLFWSIEEHKEELKGTTLLYDIQRDIYNIESEYKRFILPFIYRYKDICGTVERYSLALYKRLVAFVMSYSFTEDYEPSMIPMADILNHSTKNNAKLLFNDENVEVIAIKNINKGEEIFNTFGNLGNAELLQTYGYADKEPNVYDTLPILVNTFLDVMEKEQKVSDSYFQAKVSLLNKTEIAHSDDYFLFDRNGMRRGPDLLQMLKILFMPESEFDELLKSRAGNRPDSFYQKLLRKLKLSKKTDTSSGVAVIDITEEEPEQEPAPKRKLDVELHEIEDSEPPIKQSCDDTMSFNSIPVVQLTQSHPERSFPLSMLQPDNGNSMCNAILIDDDDSDDDGEKAEDSNPVDTSKSDTIDEKQPNKENDKNGVDAQESGNVKDTEGANLLPIADEECSSKSVESEKMEVETIVNNNAKDVEKPVEETVDEKSEDSNSLVKEGINEDDDTDKISDILEGNTSSKDPVKEDCNKEDVNKDEIMECEKNGDQEKDSTSKSEAQESKDTPVVSKENADTCDNILSIGDDDIDDDEDEHDSDVDDILIVKISEEIRCKMTYEILNKDLKPEWKEFIKNVCNFQINSLKSDEQLTADDAREKLSDRKFYSHQIRQGHHFVAKILISGLDTTDLKK